MKKCYIIAILLFLLVCGLGAFSFLPAWEAAPAAAYTDEEKAQAKAWLSAHGYPPTMEGAYQAYHDYLSGALRLSGEEQELVNKRMGKLPEKEKKKTDKKTKNKKKKTKKKKEKKKKEKKKKAGGGKTGESPNPTADPGIPDAGGRQEAPAEKTASSTASAPSVAPGKTESGDMGDARGAKSGGEIERRVKYAGIAVGAILLFAIAFVCIRRKKGR